MRSRFAVPSWLTQAVLHPAFALTGVVQAIGGPLLPSLAPTFHLSDSESGLLFLLYFAGTSMGPFFYRVRYTRTMVLGYMAIAVCCAGVAMAGHALLALMYLLLGIGVGVPMSGGNLYVGRAFPERCAPMLTLLNFSWSAGALAAPLLAARVLMHHSYRAAYWLLAGVAVLTAIAFLLAVPEVEEPPRASAQATRRAAFFLIAVFAVVAFLQVGVENTSITWLATFALRAGGTGVVLAAASTSLYWTGFLASRGLSSFLLLRVKAAHVFRGAVALAFGASITLALVPLASVRIAAMFVLGVALAPIYPLVLAGFFARARHTLDSRWVMTVSGFGGATLPWLAGWISTHTGSLRLGMLVIPAGLLCMALVVPALSNSPEAPPAGS
jgi:MFS transporter, FHS family, glucose/mannose:H+ symporter